MNDSDGFFGSRGGGDNASRPRAMNPVTGREQSWQRASNYAAPLDDPHGLIKWKLRELVKGISQRPDLARMLLTGAVIEDNAKADQVIEAAHAVAGLDVKANEGTATHAALSRSFLGHAVPDEYVPHVKAFAAELKRNGLTPVATEVRTLCVALGVIGHTDWIVKTADGRYLILDVKTGRISHAQKFSVQCVAYGASEYIDDGSGNWIPIPFEIDRTEAILAHVDPETGATSLYSIDLRLGMYGAVLAEKVRGWAKMDVLSPFVPRPANLVGKIEVTEPRPASVAPQLQPQAVNVQGRVDQAAIGGTVLGPSEAQMREIEARQSSPIVPAEPDFVCRYDGKAASAHPVNIPGQFHCISPVPHGALTNNEAFPQPEKPSAPTAPPVEFGTQPNTMPGTGPEYDNLQNVGAAELFDLAVNLDRPNERGKVAHEILRRTGLGHRLTPDQVNTIDRAWSARGLGPLRAAIEALPESVKTHLASPMTPSALQPEQQPAPAAVAPSTSIEDERAELMQAKNDKPTLQRMAKDLGLTDLAHNRPWLADWIIATRRGCDNAEAVMFAKSKGTMNISGVPTSAVQSAEPSPEQDTAFLFKAIEGAVSVGALAALRDNVVERRGDQAWTAEMTAAAAARVAELDAATGVKASPALVLERVVAKLAQATEQAHVAQIWHEVTRGGDDEAAWTTEMNDAAQARMSEIQAAQGPPPANPFGSTSG